MVFYKPVNLKRLNEGFSPTGVVPPRGVTLIELLLVVSILGLLSVVVLPRYINVKDDAKASVLNSVQSAIAVVSEMTYSQSLMEGTAQLQFSENSKGQPLHYGYPRVLDNALTKAYFLNKIGVLDPAFSISVTDDVSATISFVEDKADVDCKVVYSPPRLAGEKPSIIVYDEHC